MKVIHFVQNFSPLSQTFIYDLITNLNKRKEQQNLVVTYKRVLEEERPFEHVLIAAQICPFYKKLSRALHRFKIRILAEPKVKQLRKTMKVLREYDIFHAHFGRSGYYAFKANGTEDFAQNTVVSLHGTDTTKHLANDGEYRETLVRGAANGCLFVANSKYLANKAIALGLPAKNIRIVHNSVNHLFRKAERYLPYRGGTLNVVCVGRLIPWKGHEFLLRAVPALLDSIGNVRVTVVGEGKEKAFLHALAFKLSIENNVYFTGAVQHEELPALLSKNHIYVQPSVHDCTTGQEESFCVAMLEALSVGLPVVITNTGGMPEVVEYHSSRCARIVDEKSPQSICDGILSVCKEPGSFLLDIPDRTNVLERYSSEKQIDMLLSVYHEMLQKRKPEPYG
jgi:glycosyltransferase involved in cell wall biosynthesis